MKKWIGFGLILVALMIIWITSRDSSMEEPEIVAASVPEIAPQDTHAPTPSTALVAQPAASPTPRPGPSDAHLSPERLAELRKWKEDQGIIALKHREEKSALKAKHQQERMEGPSLSNEESRELRKRQIEEKRALRQMQRQDIEALRASFQVTPEEKRAFLQEILAEKRLEHAQREHR